jgi:glycerol uptake facilitator protein
MATHSYRRTLMGQLLAEVMGTAILILFGVGVVAQVVTGQGGLGEYSNITWAWGLGVTFGVYTAARTSGAHLNPAVTLALAVFRGFEWRKVLPYMGAQVVGAFIAALIVRGAYHEAIIAVDPETTIETQGIFSTLPGNGAIEISHMTALFDQIIGTALLLFLILAVIDVKNNAPVAWMAPFIIGLIVVAIGMAWGTNAGYAINPARDFGPRLASWLTGYETAFQDQGGALYFWVPIVGPLIGGLIGAGLYVALIGPHLPEVEEAPEVGRTPVAVDNGQVSEGPRPTAGSAATSATVADGSRSVDVRDGVGQAHRSDGVSGDRYDNPPTR